MRKWITFDLDGTLMQNPFGAFIFPEIIEKMLKLSKKPYDVYKALVNEHLVRMKTKQYVAAYDWDDIVATHLQEMNIDCEIDVEKLVKKHSEKPKSILIRKGNIKHPSTIKKTRIFISSCYKWISKISITSYVCTRIISLF